MTQPIRLNHGLLPLLARINDAPFEVSFSADEEYDLDAVSGWSIEFKNLTGNPRVRWISDASLVTVTGQSIAVSIPLDTPSDDNASVELSHLIALKSCAWSLTAMGATDPLWRVQGQVDFVDALDLPGDGSANLGSPVTINLSDDTSIYLTITTGGAGPAGADGADGADGPAGPNEISTATDSSITGLIKGAAGKAAQAVAGTDYLAPDGDGSQLTGISTFDPTEPGPIGGTTPDAGYFTTLESADSVAISDMTDVWNDSGTTFTALKMNVTDTASAAGSLLFDYQVGGVSKLHADKSGHLLCERIYLRAAKDRYIHWSGSTISANYGFQIDASGLTFGDRASGGISFGSYGSAGSTASQPIPCFIGCPNPFTIQLGVTADTVATAQTIRSHNVTTGKGGDLVLQGGTGSTENGDVILDGGNRAAYDASPSATTIRDILISHGLMAAS